MSMSCPQCGAWAQIKETRTNKDKNIVTRRYECGNMHRFSTEERVKDELLRLRMQPRPRLPNKENACD